jgi:hypothetical protein
VTADAMKLVKFVCVASAHANARSEAALTIHDGAWAFCPTGADAEGHEWQPSDGLPLIDAMRFTPRQPAPEPVSTAPARPTKSAAPAAGGTKAVRLK